MFILNRILIWLTPVFIFIIFKLIFLKPIWIFWLLPVFFFFLVFIIFQLTNYQFEKFKIFLITPLIFLASGYLFIIFLEINWIKYFIILILALLSLVFLETSFLKLYKPDKYQSGSLENISNYLNLISIFFLATGLFSLLIFLAISLWILALILIIITGLLTYEIMAVSDILFLKSWLYIIITSLIIFELFWVISFFPSSVYVNSLIITLSYYLLIGLGLNNLLGRLQPNVIKRYLLISLLCFIIIFSTAKWL